MREAPKPGIGSKLQGLSHAFVRYARARLDLLQHELRREQARVLRLLAQAGIFAVGALITLELLCAVILIAFWDTPWRLHSAIGLLLMFGGVTFFAWRSLSTGGKTGAAFSTSLAEFDKDREVLTRLATEMTHAEAPQPSEVKRDSAARAASASVAANRAPASAAKPSSASVTAPTPSRPLSPG